LLTVGKLGAVLGLHPDTIRRYEREGLIPAARRSPLNGYRFWTEEDIEGIRRAVFGLDESSERAGVVNA
jgi:DNA-binding transcriptional MerR regulator